MQNQPSATHPLGSFPELNSLLKPITYPRLHSRPISILIADDQLLLRQIWAQMLSADTRFTVVADCSRGDIGIQSINELQPDVIILDTDYKGSDGLEYCKTVLQVFPLAKILGISMHTDPSYARRLMRLGVMGYVSKHSPKEEMFKAIVSISQKTKYICEEVKLNLAQVPLEREKGSYLQMLSTREREIADLIRRGYSSKKIAVELGLSAKTIDMHRYNIRRKLNVKNTAALVNYLGECFSA